MPLEPYNKEDNLLGRPAINKQFYGDLNGTGTVEMLTAGTKVKGSAGYVRYREGYRSAQRAPRNFFPAAQRHHEPGGTATKGDCRSRLWQGRPHRRFRRDGHHYRKGQAFVCLRVHPYGQALEARSKGAVHEIWSECWRGAPPPI